MRYLNFAAHVVKSTMLEIVIAIIDLSGSMETDDWKPSRKAGAIKANKELIKAKAKNYPQDKVGIIGFGTDAEILHEPVCVGHGTKSLYKALKSPPLMGSTNFTAALELAGGCLRGCSTLIKKSSAGKGFSRFISDLLYGPTQQSSDYIKEISKTPRPLKRIIMLTDGGHNAGSSPAKLASRLKNAGVVIDCIGIGGSPEDVDEALLREIASPNPADGSIRYCFIGDQQKLIRKYESLAHHIRPA